MYEACWSQNGFARFARKTKLVRTILYSSMLDTSSSPSSKIEQYFSGGWIYLVLGLHMCIESWQLSS